MKPKYLGASGFLGHDASFSLLDDGGNILFASLSERYSKIKHDKFMCQTLWDELYHKNKNVPGFEVVYHDKCLHNNYNPNIPSDPNKRIEEKFPTEWSDSFSGHPESHACAALMTRPESFAKEDCVLVSCDGVGENKSMVIFDHNLNIKKYHNQPKSVGFLYTSFTRHCGLGLIGNSEEYIVMGLSSYGEPTHWEFVYDAFHCIQESSDDHDRGTRFGWDLIFKYCTKPLLQKTKNVEDAAASLQKATEVILYEFMQEARKYGSKLCYSGGVAQNIMANSKIAELFDDVWVDVCPHDGGGSLGAAAWKYWKDTGNDRINWQHPFLGHEIEGTVDPEEVVEHLLSTKYCGIANGRAEFGPRAYGNRSLIADVRYDVKDTVNEIKRRQKYRPFAPAILEEHAEEYFEGEMNRWMQFTAKAKHDYNSVTHVDGTARVQLVPKDCHSVFRKVIECYYEKTGIPMLLNTSLNIRGEPMVNSFEDAKRWESQYNVRVFTGK